MPQIVVPDEGELFLLDALLRSGSPDAFLIHLYTNNYTPVKDSELADFTEAAYTGYSPVALARSSWSSPETVGGYAQCVYGTAPLEFAPESGTDTVYGYFVTDADETVCLWAEGFSPGVEIDAMNPLLLQPIMRLRSESQPES